MNRIMAAGLVAEAEQGKRVLVLSGSQQMAHEAFRQIVEVGRPDIFKAIYTNGAQSVQLADGGRIDFRSVRSTGSRGISADLLFIDHDADEAFRSRPGDFIAAIATSAPGELNRA